MGRAVLLLAAFLPICPRVSDAAAPLTPEQAEAAVKSGRLEPLRDGATTFIQVSDTHTQAPRPRSFRHTPELLSQVLAEAAQLYPAASFVVCTGDNCDTHYSIIFRSIFPPNFYYTSYCCDCSYSR